jgi:hypothetical protein
MKEHEKLNLLTIYFVYFVVKISTVNHKISHPKYRLAPSIVAATL